MKIRLFIVLFILAATGIAQEKTEQEYNAATVQVNRFIDGTLMTPYSDTQVPLIIFVMDAGMINRDGNDQLSRNDTFKSLAITLAKHGIATYRYDKRLFRINALGIHESAVSIDHFIEDTQAIVRYFAKNNTYSKIILAGHGQGSLISIKAATNAPVDALISIAGNAQAIDQIIIQQLTKQAPGLDKSATIAFKELREQGRATNYEPALASIFAHSIQPFMKSWIQYTPSEVIKALDIPILILQGNKDLLVETTEGELLKQAVPNATYMLIPDMNHILREIKGNRLENHKSYNEHWRKIMPEVIDSIVKFVHS